MTSSVACPRGGGPSRSDALQRLSGVCLPWMAGTLFEDGASATPAPVFPLKPGDRFRGLEIGGLIGAGRMGVVVRAVHLERGCPVALKLLPPRFAQDAGAAARFLREAQALAKLDQAGIVKVHDFGRKGEVCYLVMEFAEGTPLHQLLAAYRLPTDRAMRIVTRICTALEYAHQRGIVHRDIKPENILVGAGDSVKVATSA